MAEKVLYSVWLDPDMAARAEAIKRGYCIDNAEMLRQALGELFTRLEAHPAPFAVAVDAHGGGV